MCRRVQVYQGFYELNPSKAFSGWSTRSSISGILWVEPQQSAQRDCALTKYIRDFMSWTPASPCRTGMILQVYQGFYELNPSLPHLTRESDTSISGILWVEPQRNWLRNIWRPKYIRDFMSWTPAATAYMSISGQVYQGFYELNPSVR